MIDISRCGFAVLAIGTMSIIGFGQRAPIPMPQPVALVKIAERGAIASYNPSTNQQHVLLTSTDLWLHDITISPSGSYIAYIEETPGVSGPTRYETPPKRALVILDRAGARLGRLDNDIKTYVWSPDGTKVAFLSFKPCDPDYSFKCPTGVWIYDIPGSTATKIAERGYDVVWARHNDCVYVRDFRSAGIWCMGSDSIRQGVFPAIHFSPDGKFVIYEPIYEDDTPRGLFRTYDFGNMTASLPKDLGAMVDWVFTSGHYLLFTKTDATVETGGDGPVKYVKSRTIHSIKHSIYDPEKGQVIKQFEGPISSWVGDGSRIIVERNGKVEFEEKPD